MRKVFKYRIYPSKSQVSDMLTILEECRWLYNHFLGERNNAYAREKRSINLYNQLSSIPDIKKYVEFIAYARTLQNVGTRVELAYQAFFRRCKNGEKPGYPRFKSYGRYDSFTYPQDGYRLEDDGKRVYLSKIGSVKIKLHRPVRGIIKTTTVKRESTGKWFVSFSCTNIPAAIVPDRALPSVGIDVGIKSFATFSDGTKIENPKFFKRSEKRLTVAQRRLAKEPKGSEPRKKKRLVVSRVHEKIKNQRKDFVFKLACFVSMSYGIICIEDLSINRMGKDKRFSKSIYDAAWAMFFKVLIHKAEEAGGQVVPVNPAYTSQDCSQCGTRALKSLDERVHSCPDCGLVMDRDLNAAKNILAVGLHSLAEKPKSPY